MLSSEECISLISRTSSHIYIGPWFVAFYFELTNNKSNLIYSGDYGHFVVSGLSSEGF